MGTRYVIAVMKVEDVEGSENRYDTRDTTLFEATHADPARLARFAPEEVLAVLAEAAEVEMDVSALGVLRAAHWANGDRFTIPAQFGDETAQVPENTIRVTVEPAGPRPTEEDDVPKPKRKRRTNAQIAADKAAQAAGFRDAAHRATEQRLDGEPELALPEQVAESIEQHAAAADVFGQSATGAAPGEAFADAAGGSAPHADASPPPAASAPTSPAPIYDPFK